LEPDTETKHEIKQQGENLESEAPVLDIVHVGTTYQYNSLLSGESFACGTHSVFLIQHYHT
jgi:hypothetical protein